MIDTLNFGKYINFKLNGIAPKVSPLVVDNKTDYPYIIYGRSNMSSSTCKDGIYENTVTIDIRVVTSTYEHGLELINKVRESLEIRDVTFNDMRITDAYITSAAERYTDNAFIQDIQFTFIVERG